MECRLINEIGTRAYLRVYWEGKECGHGYHNAMTPILDSTKLNDWDLAGDFNDYMPDAFPTHCDKCGQEAPAEANRQLHRSKLYDNESGRPEPGDMYYAAWYHQGEDRKHHCRHWDNCTDPRGHLMVVLPNGHEWDTDSRARNCTMPEDRSHRCWVKTGEAPNVSAHKNGITCMAGAGSIQAGDYHGYLNKGQLVTDLSHVI